MTEECRRFLITATGGNQAAFSLCLNYTRVADLFDNLYDGDKKVLPSEVTELLWLCCAAIPSNEFFVQHRHTLTPILAVGILNWSAANEFEKVGHIEDLVKAHNLRHNVGSVLHVIMLLCVGFERATALGPQLWRYIQPETLEDYLKEKGLTYGNVR